MATVSGLSADEMQRIADASVTGGAVDTNGNLILQTRGGTSIPAGNVVGPITAGLVTMFAGATAPAGWLLCDGTAISRTAYATLFALIGTTYGDGDGSTTFNLPNLKGRIPVGRDAAQTEFDTVGETGGEKTHLLTTTEMPAHKHVHDQHFHAITDNGHTHTQGQHNHGVTDLGHTHTQGQHNHGVTDNGHTHTYSSTTGSGGSHNHSSNTLYGFLVYNNTGTVTRSRFASGTSGNYAFQTSVQTDIDYSSVTDTAPTHTHTVSGTTGGSGTGVTVNNATPPALSTNGTGVTVNNATPPALSTNGTGISVNNATSTEQNAGGGLAHNNLQPYVVMNYIIKF